MHEELLKRASSPKVDRNAQEIPSVVEVVDPNFQPKNRKVSELATTDDETPTDRDGNVTPTTPGAITGDKSGSRRKYRVLKKRKVSVSELATTDDETSTDRDGNATPTTPDAITVDTSGSRRKYRVVRNFFHTLHILRVTYTYFVCTYNILNIFKTYFKHTSNYFLYTYNIVNVFQTYF